MYYLFYVLVRLLTLLPLRVLYFFSDLLYYIIYYIVRYRRKVVRKNLVETFPEKKFSEITVIEKKFYRYFCDLILETLKQINISDKELKHLFSFKNVELLIENYNAGRSIFIMSSHYCNWEVCASLNLKLPAEKPLYNVYKKLKNKKFDTFMLKLRSRYGGINLEKDMLIRTLIELKNSNKQFSVGMISDQSPRRSSNRTQLNFLGRKTWFFTGTEVLARKFNMPVYYAKISRIKRGSYVCEIVPVCSDIQNSTDGEITQKFASILEEQILENPEFWLWTHKRWKN